MPGKLHLKWIRNLITLLWLLGLKTIELFRNLVSEQECSPKGPDKNNETVNYKNTWYKRDEDIRKKVNGYLNEKAIRKSCRNKTRFPFWFLNYD